MPKTLTFFVKGTGVIENFVTNQIEFGDGTVQSTAAFNLWKNYNISGAIIYNGGKVIVGNKVPHQAHQDFMMSVDGKIYSKGMRVLIDNKWADFVFDSTYNLQPLSTVEAFIKANQRLPEMPSAKEVEQNGLSLEEIVRLQMIKIEEMTLHLIRQEKEIENLKTVIKKH